MAKFLSFLFLLLASCSNSACYHNPPPPASAQAAKSWEGALLATAQVEATDALGTSIGTAWLHSTVGPSATWVTAGHVCSPGAMYTITHDGQEYGAAELKRSDEPDLCSLVTFGEVRAAPLRLAADEPEVGDELCYTGNPLGFMAYGASPVFCGKAAGSGLGHTFVAIPGMSGASGSAVVNAEGRVVGVLVATARGWPEIVFLVPLEDLRKFME